MGCDLLQLSASYVKGIPPRGNNSIVLSMTILNVTDVRVLEGLVKTHLEINLLWSDSRSMVELNYQSICNYESVKNKFQIFQQRKVPHHLHRLSFMNLNADNSDANILSQSEYASIWQPVIKYINKDPSAKENIH